MVERKAHKKDAKFWAQAIGPGVAEWRPRVGTAHLNIYTPGIVETRLTHNGIGRSTSALDSDTNTLHLPYGSTAGVEIITTKGSLELVAAYIMVKQGRPASIIIRTGDAIKTKLKDGKRNPWMDGGFRTTLDPYSQCEVRVGNLVIQSVTDIL